MSPAYLDLELGKGRPSQSLSVANVTDEETRYRIQIVHFGFSKDGSVEMVPPDQHSLANWIKCNPREFTLPPRASRTIRLTVIPPKSLEPGEYWAAVWFEPLTSHVTTTRDSLGRRGNVRIVTNVLVPIFGQVARVTYRCELADLAAVRVADGVDIVARLTNTGSARLQLKGSFEVLAADGTRVAEGPIGTDTILAGGERVFSQAVKGVFPDKQYTVRVRYESAKLPAVLGGQTLLGRE